MALKFKIKSKDEIPAGLEAHYVEREGGWVLDAEGAVEKGKLDEFRANNIKLSQELAEQKKRFEGIDPEQVRKLAEEKQRLEEAQQIKAGEVEKVVEARVKAARGELEKQVAAVRAERDALNVRLVTIQIDQGVVAAASKRGLRPTAIPDITARARQVFRLVNGVPLAFEADGQTVRVGKDGSTAMTLDEWVEQQVADAPHLFESNAGGGAAGNGSGGAGGNRSGRNPFRKETWNLTEQMKLERTDPALAARLRAAA
ncbi:MAG TPA: hypothetical protein PLV05_02150 [Verrucomicrobiota bacterium]|nr:hypothetical protein [Verrucomicrobiota bacterium]HOQ57374.1 hypothetical protein [Verrucomicrobiota bacterium]HPC51883.1 hypothetical protein [Verrucomicrobiota bacterium]HPL37726.1 hypothetical protein [Verrucomicrobiota bacterium]HRV39108.1 hypothetical protein [Candidatus Paceibacterota bacterium]